MNFSQEEYFIKNLLRIIGIFLSMFIITMTVAQDPVIILPELPNQSPVLANPDISINPNACDEEKMKEIRAAATESKSFVKIDCDLTLRPDDVITKRLIFEGPKASGVRCNCNGGKINGGKNTVNHKRDMIEVKSKKTNVTSWNPARNIIIKKCDIIGSVRIWGMGKNGESEDVKESSRRDANSSNHVSRIRASAPSHIVLDDVTITGVGRNPMYFGPGVTHSKLINSELKGKSDKVGLYLDAESAFNTIANNNLHVNTDDDDWGAIPLVTNRGWPQMAIDGSSRNIIKNNWFSAINNGGIYLYRNCGEGGTIRHTPPEHNLIINNSFYYKKYKGNKPAIYLASRDYGFKENTFGHCDADDGRPYGSSKSDKDFARHNIIVQNKLFKRKIRKSTSLGQSKLVNATLGDMIRTKNTSLNSPNLIKYNELVSRDIKRSAGCYVKDGYKDFLLHGESIDVYKRSNGRLVCTGIRRTCNDGEVIESFSNNCRITEVPFDCKVEGKNSGCKRTASCPFGQVIVGAKAACNLEFGEITDNTLRSTAVNTIKVHRSSDKVSDGLCFIEQNKIRKGSKSLDDIQDLVRAVIGCKEKDKNGGDCHIKGILYCR